MNAEVAKEIFELRYSTRMNYDQFAKLLEKGLGVLERNPAIDKLVASRICMPEELNAVNIALDYNQEIMVKHLML